MMTIVNIDIVPLQRLPSSPHQTGVWKIYWNILHCTLWWISHKSCKSEYPPIAGSMISPKNSETFQLTRFASFVSWGPSALGRITLHWVPQYWVESESVQAVGLYNIILTRCLGTNITYCKTCCILQCWIPVWMIFGSHPGNNVTKLWFFSIREGGP